MTCRREIATPQNLRLLTVVLKLISRFLDCMMRSAWQQIFSSLFPVDVMRSGKNYRIKLSALHCST